MGLSKGGTAILNGQRWSIGMHSRNAIATRLNRNIGTSVEILDCNKGWDNIKVKDMRTGTEFTISGNSLGVLFNF
jgi:hypothetical protein